MQSSTIWLQNTESMVQKMRKMKDSGIEWIGEIPEGWEVVKAKYLFAQRNEKGNSALVLLSPTQNMVLFHKVS